MLSQTRMATLVQGPWSTRASLQCTYYTLSPPPRGFNPFVTVSNLTFISKPTHYTVVYDESRLGADEVQQGINTASYLYVRATRSVSLIPPAYYADLACERGRCYLNEFLVPEDNTTTTSREEEKRVFDNAMKVWGNGIHPNLFGSMFCITRVLVLLE
jgi:hypothetical protein